MSVRWMECSDCGGRHPPGECRLCFFCKEDPCVCIKGPYPFNEKQSADTSSKSLPFGSPLVPLRCNLCGGTGFAFGEPCVVCDGTGYAREKHKIQWEVNTLDPKPAANSLPSPEVEENSDPPAESKEKSDLPVDVQGMLEELDSISDRVNRRWMELMAEGAEEMSRTASSLVAGVSQMQEELAELDAELTAPTLSSRDEVKALVGRRFQKENEVRIVIAISKLRTANKGRPTGQVKWKSPDGRRVRGNTVGEFRKWLKGATEVQTT